ncbi:hypothetical protein DFH28DRAFT_1169292 [Melampsora americana]|nr:hypothetical protein DFH28DRAFT_1169292 [Melampsora americana]
MYSLKSNPSADRRRKQSATLVNETTIKSNKPRKQLGKSKEVQDDINDSSSLTALSDHEDHLADLSVLGKIGGLQSGPGKTAATSTHDSTCSWDAEETLIDQEILASTLGPEPTKDLIDLRDMDVFQLPNVVSITAGFMDVHHINPSCACNVNCRSEIEYLKARIEKLEDLVFEPYRVPPPAVAAILEEYKNL